MKKPYTEEEISIGFKKMKNDKNLGIDNMNTEYMSQEQPIR